TPGACGEYLTVQEMAGFQMILCKLDADHVGYFKAAARAPYWTA
ncbi:MAG: glycerol kinase, partial [Verrucomicrobiota bacterium]|nr:glycerol kinase [Verrucomicrobiota bacterium]